MKYSENIIFVFGSNEAGIHGAGAAKYAADHLGAKHGIGKGLTGFAYALPTKDKYFRTLPLSIIQTYLRELFLFAKNNPNKVFNLTPVGCGLAGLQKREIIILLKQINENVEFPDNILFDNRWMGFNGG